LGRSVLLAAITLLTSGLLPGIGAVHAQQAEPAPLVQMVNINKADAASLAAALNGVGASRAEEIVRYREAFGPFKSVEELADVKGIGPSTLEKNRALITLE
jgi:competence protein ComEA